MDIIQCYLTNNRCYKIGTKMKVKGVMWHCTGANNPYCKRYAQPTPGSENYNEVLAKIGTNRYGNSWNRSNIDVCVHHFIGKLADESVGIVQTLPWEMRGWHAGSGSKGSANDGWVSFEMCEDGLTDKTYFNKVYECAVWLTAKICTQYKLDPYGDGVIICHQDGYKRGIASNHADVYNWFNKMGKTMDDVRNDVAKAMGKTPEPEPIPTPEPVKVNYYIQSTTSVLNIRSGPGTNYSITGQIKDKNSYKIVAESEGTGAKKWGQLDNGKGWISLDYTKKVTNSQEWVGSTTAILNIRKGPGTNYPRIGVLRKGVNITILEESGNWGKVKNKNGWVCLDYVKEKGVATK